MRHHLKLAVPLALLATAALSGCAQQGVSPGAGASSGPPAVSAPSAPTSSSPSTPTAPAPSGSAALSACQENLTVVANDNGKTLCVSTGGTVTIDLDPSATGGAPFDVTGDVLKAGAAQGTFAAVKPGMAVVTTQRRSCPKPTPGSGMVACNSIQLWRVSIVVK